MTVPDGNSVEEIDLAAVTDPVQLFTLWNTSKGSYQQALTQITRHVTFMNSIRDKMMEHGVPLQLFAVPGEQTQTQPILQAQPVVQTQPAAPQPVPAPQAVVVVVPAPDPAPVLAPQQDNAAAVEVEIIPEAEVYAPLAAVMANPPPADVYTPQIVQSAPAAGYAKEHHWGGPSKDANGHIVIGEQGEYIVQRRVALRPGAGVDSSISEIRSMSGVVGSNQDLNLKNFAASRMGILVGQYNLRVPGQR